MLYEGGRFSGTFDSLGVPQEGRLAGADLTEAGAIADAEYSGLASSAALLTLPQSAWADRLLSYGVSCWYMPGDDGV